MSAGFSALTSDWGERPIPALRMTRDRLAGLLRRAERLKPAEVAEIVLTDPLLTAAVMREASRRARTSMSVDIVSVEAAVMLFGVLPFLERHARGVALEVALAGDDQRLASCLALISRAQLSARIARKLGSERMDARPDELQVAALLSPLAELMSLLDGTNAIAVPALETVLRHWRFPETLCQLCADGEPASQRQRLQQSALALALALESGWWGDGVSAALQDVAEVLDVAEEAAWRMVHEPLLAHARSALGSGVIPAATWLPMQPGEWPRVAPGRDVLAVRMQALHLGGLQGLPANQVMRLAVKALLDGLQMRRVLFAMPQNGLLTARFCVGAAENDPLRNLSLPLTESHLFSQLLQKPQAVWLSGESRAKLTPQLPASVLAQVGDEDFCAMSLFVGDKAVGMLFADRAPASPIDAQTYQYFKQICQLTSRALASRTA
ncbi:hypothetical protein JHS3_09290 [Jeongeupia sp. HS-3]|uniref:HDOD domain-containing protein n=1 Tax=Jeongeupia sp. HS-3 TaxID=1009682 RepID=UPI0018A4592F|nr:HDOD domain-containing protein [Jeongeupia sp. HS-3]BCL75193.1 hypothetical protein JHS3_09290 [Jeongeupia sp. HS-3]